ncbi:YadA C-terminal domain-containing protein, partial [Coraliomargarita sp. SDUM461004]
SDIASNDTNIVSNASDIASNDTNIVSNASDIASNDTNIVSNASDIASNNTNIVSNAGDIASNNTNIVSNQTDIVSNAATIQQEIDDRTDLIRREADGIHIGDSSFILDDTAGAHRITSNDGSLILGGGAVSVVDVDADLDVAGDIYTSGDVFIGGSTVGVQTQLNSLDSRIDAYEQQVSQNKKQIERNSRGIAMVAALQHTTVLPGMTNALDVAAAHFDGETGMSLNYARRINENWQINFGAASTTDFEESVVKAGVGYQW